MFKILKLFLIFLFVSHGSQVFAEKKDDISNFLTEHSNLQFIFIFPVIEDRVGLKVTIPKDFKALEADPSSELLEFIPKTDQDPYKWSEIITLNKILGTGITASVYIEKLKDLFTKSDPNTKVLENDKHNYEAGYEDAWTILKYHSNGREEVVILYSISGPLDIANVQYALPLSSPSKLNETINKLKNFIKSNLEVIRK